MLQHTFRLALIGLSLTLAACSQPDPQTRTSSALASDVLLPAYAVWEQSNQHLAGSAQAFCTGSQNLAQARRTFIDTQIAWAALQPLQIGPLTENNLSWQVQFWPDKHNLVARQVEQLLKTNPQIGEHDLQEASVVVQGLSAYEYLLFDPAIDLTQTASKARYCPLLTAIAQHQQKLAGEVFQLWKNADGMAAQLESFPNARYADSAEAIAALLDAQVTGLERLKKKLGTPLGRQSKGIPQPYQAEGWRSGTTLPSLAAGLGSAERIWQGQPDDGLRSLLDASQSDLIERIDNAYAQTWQQLIGLEKPVQTLLSDEPVRQQLDELYDSLDQLHRLYKHELAKALGVQLGFNANDGD